MVGPCRRLLIATFEMFSVKSETRDPRELTIGTAAQPQAMWSGVPSTELVLRAQQIRGELIR